MANMENMETLTGRIAVQLVARGSKSERMATVLIDDDPASPPVVLRGAEFDGLGPDPGLEAWVGQHVTVEGQRAFSTFRVTAVRVAPR